MAEVLKPYLCIIRDALDFALDLRNFPSQLYEKLNRPQVEVKESDELLMKPIVVCRNEDEKIEIEPSINSVRINIVIKKHANLEELLMSIYSKYLMNRADRLNIFKKKPKDGLFKFVLFVLESCFVSAFFHVILLHFRFSFVFSNWIKLLIISLYIIKRFFLQLNHLLL